MQIVLHALMIQVLRVPKRDLMLHKMLLTFALIAFVSAPSTVLAAVGLLCPSQSEPPRILIVDIDKSNFSFFKLSTGKWDTNNSITIYHDRIVRFYEPTFVINRKTMVMTTKSDVDWKNRSKEVSINCSVHTVPDIERVAAREWERISNSRGF